jgi:hypothetical protein
MLFCFILILASGCVASNLAEVVTALGKDPASVCINLSTIYGNLKVARTNISNGDVTCAADGLVVKSQASQVGIPVVITPEISVGAPRLAK